MAGTWFAGDAGANRVSRTLNAGSVDTISDSGGDNAFGQDLFADESSTTVTAPIAADYLCQCDGQMSTDVLPSTGTAIAQRMWFQFTVGGTGTGSIHLYDFEHTDSYIAFSISERLTLGAGDAVGVDWGFGATQTGVTVTVNAGRSLSITTTL